MKMKFRNLIAAAAVLAIPAFLAGTARATTFPVTGYVWQGAAVYENPCTDSLCTNMTTPFTLNGTPITGTTSTGTANDSFWVSNTSASPLNFYSNTDNNLSDFLTTGGGNVANGNTAPNYLTGGNQVYGGIGNVPAGTTGGINNDVIDFTGTTYLQNGATYSIAHDDGMYLYVDGMQVISTNEATTSGEATADGNFMFTWTGASGLDNFSLWYSEVNGAPAVLSAPDLAVTPEPPSLLLLGTGLLGMAFLLFRRKVAKPVSHATLSA
ncbi:MAG: PEP-CTERM sorting domain-containing protein [Acidobacteriaceae bacterium]